MDLSGCEKLAYLPTGMIRNVTGVTRLNFADTNLGWIEAGAFDNVQGQAGASVTVNFGVLSFVDESAFVGPRLQLINNDNIKYPSLPVPDSSNISR